MNREYFNPLAGKSQSQRYHLEREKPRKLLECVPAYDWSKFKCSCDVIG